MRKIIISGVCLVVSLLVFYLCFSIVPAGHVGVVSVMGDVSNQPLYPGAHFVNPFSVVHNMDCRILKDAREQAAASKDMQDVNVSLGLNYHLKPEMAVQVFKTIGTEWSDRIIPNAESETLKSEIAQHVASDILQNRVAIKAAVEMELAKWLSKYGIYLDEVSIANIRFSSEYSAAIERKQVEEQTALQRVYQLQTAQRDAEIAKAKAVGEGDAILVRATAQAQANKLLSQSLTETLLVNAQIEKWNGILPGVMVSGTTPFILGGR